MIIVLVAFIATIFLDWGMNVSGLSPKARAAGKIDGKEVPLSYFDQQVIAERQRIQEDRRDASPMELKRVPQDVWEREVYIILMTRVIQQMKLGASADQVFEYIKRNPLPGVDTASLFQTNGVLTPASTLIFSVTLICISITLGLTTFQIVLRRTLFLLRLWKYCSVPTLTPSRSEIEHQYRLEKENWCLSTPLSTLRRSESIPLKSMNRQLKISTIRKRLFENR